MTTEAPRPHVRYLGLVRALAQDLEPREPSPAPRGPFRRWFGVVIDPRAHTSLAFMLCCLGTGVLSFTLVVVGLSLSVGLVPILVGIPLFLGFVAVMRTLGLLEHRIIVAICGDAGRDPEPDPAPRGRFLERLVGQLRERRTWSTLLYQVAMLPLGILYFSMAVVGLAVSLALIVAPFIWALVTLGVLDGRLGPSIPLTIDGWDVTWVQSPLGVVAGSLIGGMLFMTTLHGARLLISAHAILAKAMLGGPDGQSGQLADRSS